MKHLKSLAVILSVLLLPCSVAAQQERGQTQNGLGVEITSSDGAKATLYVLASNPAPENLFGIIRVPRGQVARTQAGEVISGFKFVPRLENNALRIEVSALTGNREQTIATHFANRGEKVRVLEMSQFGIEPFEMKIVDAQTMPAPPRISPFTLDYNPNVYRRSYRLTLNEFKLNYK